jgi:hypothetical protein
MRLRPVGAATPTTVGAVTGGAPIVVDAVVHLDTLDVMRPFAAAASRPSLSRPSTSGRSTAQSAAVDAAGAPAISKLGEPTRRYGD